MAINLSNSAADMTVTVNPGAPLIQYGLRLDTGPWPNAPQLKFSNGTKVTLNLSVDKTYADLNVPTATVAQLVTAGAQKEVTVALVDSVTGYPYGIGRVAIGQEVPA